MYFAIPKDAKGARSIAFWVLMVVTTEKIQLTVNTLQKLFEPVPVVSIEVTYAKDLIPFSGDPNPVLDYGLVNLFDS